MTNELCSETCLYWLNGKHYTAWDDFIKKYGDKIPYRSLNVILEAFFYYTKNNKEKCDVIINPN